MLLFLHGNRIEPRGTTRPRERGATTVAVQSQEQCVTDSERHGSEEIEAMLIRASRSLQGQIWPQDIPRPWDLEA